ncbi:unnamed protein product, partial [Rotaria sp. Silwood1]
MIYILDSSICLLLFTIIFIVQSTIFYQNDFEPRVFDYIPLNCYDCLSYRDIILTQLTTIPAQSFANFNLGSRDTNIILNGQSKYILIFVLKRFKFNNDKSKFFSNLIIVVDEKFNIIKPELID